MKKALALSLSTIAFVNFTYAAGPGGRPEIDQLAGQAAREAIRASAASVTEEEVGDVESFGRSKIYLGVEQTLPVIIQSDCTGFDPAGGVCVEPNAAPAATLVDEFNLGTIELPAGASNSLLCFTFTQFSFWLWNNPTASTATARMALRPTVQIENDVLIGLNDINGNPFNGTLFPDPSPITVFTLEQSLPSGAFEQQSQTVTRSCTGGLVSARSLAAQGLTESQIKDFFKEPMTITFGAIGSVSLIEFGQFFVGVRLYGDA